MFFVPKLFTQPDNLGMAKIISPVQKQEYLPFIKSNFGKLSQREIARRLNIGNTTVRRWSDELGYKYVKHTVNEYFFDSFNESSIYLLGLIYADGSIAWDRVKGYNSLTITSCAKDKYHLEKIRMLINSTKSLVFSSKTNSYRLIVNNKKICQKLMGLGVLPRKTLTITFPEFISDPLLPHFLRGIVDGDGNVRYVNRKRSPYFEMTIASGSKRFCDGLIEAVKNAIGVVGGLRQVGPNSYVIQYSCSRGVLLAQFIYGNAQIFLERKCDEYKKYLEVKENGN